VMVQVAEDEQIVVVDAMNQKTQMPIILQEEADGIEDEMKIKPQMIVVLFYW